jgi:hypothetical protein
MRESDQRFSLFRPSGNCKYLNDAERRRFIDAARRPPLTARHFCLTIGYSDGRISEVLALTPAAIDIESAGSLRRMRSRDGAEVEDAVTACGAAPRGPPPSPPSQSLRPY